MPSALASLVSTAPALRGGAHFGSSPVSLALLCALACACDAFEPHGNEGAEPPGVRDPVPGGDPPASSFDASSCRPCGDPLVCRDCGFGCTCSGRSNSPTAWRAPLTHVGDDGWRSSTTPLCAGVQEVSSHALWADAHGVFVAVSGFGGPLTGDSDVPEDDGGVIDRTLTAGEFAPLTRVLHNEGSGWSLRAALEGATRARVTAASPSQLILHGDAGQLDRACTLGVITHDAFSCAELSGTVPKVHAVSKTRAFALTAQQTLFQHDGSTWSPVTPELAASARDLWADADVLVVAGLLGNVHRLGAEGWQTENVGQPVELSALWGRSANDLWAGSADGKLFQFDAGGWREVAQLGGLTCMNSQPILRISGGAEHVWVHTPSQLARWTGSELETFANWTCTPREIGNENSESIDDLWAVADDDVYVAFSNVRSQSACGDAFVVHWDGAEFHRF